MAVSGTKISEMTELASVTGNEYIPVVDANGENKKVKSSNIAVADASLSGTSTKPIQNKAVYSALGNLSQVVKETNEVTI